MAKFIILASHDGELPDGYQYPPVDPAQFGLPAEDDGSRDDALLGQNLRSCTGYQLDVDANRPPSAAIFMPSARELWKRQPLIIQTAEVDGALLRI